MKRIDIYIIQKFLVTFFFSIFIFSIISIAVDSSEKSDNFVSNHLTSSQIRNYYYSFIPWIWSMLFPLFVFIAVIYFTSRMAARSEIIAILASGVSFNRLLLPYFLTGIFLATLLWLGNKTIVPKANIVRGNFQSQYIDHKDANEAQKLKGCANCYFFRADTDTYAGIRDFDTVQKIAHGFFMNKIKNGKVYYNLRSETLNWNNKKQYWEARNVVKRSIDSMQENVEWDTMVKLNLNDRPESFRNDDYLKDKLTTAQLKSFILREELKGSEGLNSYKIELYKRSATPIAVLILTMIGACVATKKSRGGSGMQLSFGILVAVIYVLFDRFSTVFSTNGNLSPFLAAWIPNIIFTIVAIFLYRKAIN